MIDKDMLGIMKYLGGSLTITAGRFNQLEIKRVTPHTLLKMKMAGYVYSNIVWVICKSGENTFVRVPFAKNKLWFDAFTSEVEFASIKELPQIFIT